MATDSEILQAGQLLGNSLKGVGESVLGLRQRKNAAEEEQRKIDLAKFEGEELAKTHYGQTEVGRLTSLGVANRDVALADVTKQLTGLPSEELLMKIAMDPNTIKDPERMRASKNAVDIYADVKKRINYGEYLGRSLAALYGPRPNEDTKPLRAVTAPSIELSPVVESLKSVLTHEGKNWSIKVPGSAITGYDKPVDLI